MQHSDSFLDRWFVRMPIARRLNFQVIAALVLGGCLIVAIAIGAGLSWRMGQESSRVAEQALKIALLEKDFTSLERDAFRYSLLRTAEAKGEPAATFPVLPEKADDSTDPVTAEFVDYYKTSRGHHPRSTGDMVTRSADLLDQYDSFADVAKIAPRPLLMIAGTEAVTRGFSEKAVADSPGNAELFLVDGATHVDLYDRDQYVTPAVAKLAEFFGKHLA